MSGRGAEAPSLEDESEVFINKNSRGITKMKTGAGSGITKMAGSTSARKSDAAEEGAAEDEDFAARRLSVANPYGDDDDDWEKLQEDEEDDDGNK